MEDDFEVDVVFEHHKYGPSQLELYEQCPCYEPDETDRDTTAADEGTLCHKAAETGNLGLLSTDEQVDAVTEALLFKADVLKTAGENAEIHTEERVRIGNLTEGTLDLLILTEGRKSAFLVDYKFGRNKVTEAEHNGQVQAYVAGVFEKYPTVVTVRATLFFPRLKWMTMATFGRQDLPKLQLRIATIIARATAEDRRPTPTEKACRFCGNKANCPALHQVALRFGEALPEPISYDALRVTDPAEVAKVLTLFSILEDMGKQVRRTATRLVVEDGITIPGFGLKSRAGAHEITDVYQAMSLIFKEFKLDVGQITQACSMSLPKLTDVVAALTEGKKKDVRDKLLEVLEPCTIQKDTITYLQRDKEKKNEQIVQGGE